MERNTRFATKAGSWYSDDAEELNTQLQDWLQYGIQHQQSSPPPDINACAIIAPHAGYSYSGRTAGFAYSNIDPSRYKRVFLIGPSHYVSLDSCALSRVRKCETPLGLITVDHKVVEELYASGEFDLMNKETDEQEHSLELHLPFLYKTFEGHQWSLVHVMAGHVSHERQAVYGRIFSRYLADAENLFVISSDFCHWGKRFAFQPYEPSHGAIHQSIEALDHEGMALIERLDVEAFNRYIKRTKNTICGRIPIGILLHAVQHLTSDQVTDGSSSTSTSSSSKFVMRFVRYEQSSQCVSVRDSSVSYAAGVLSRSVAQE